MFHQTNSEETRLHTRRRWRTRTTRVLNAFILSAATVVAGALALSSPAQASVLPGGVLPQIGASLSAASSCHGPRGYGEKYLGAVWPGDFHGVPVYSNGVSGSFTDCLHSTRTPAGRVVVDGFSWQCVELVDRLYLTKGWIESPWRGNGDQMFSTAPRSFRKQRQGFISYVDPGDVISFDGPAGNTAGHAAVVAKVDGSYLTIVNQNTDAADVLSHAHLVRGRIIMVGWAGWRPIGIVHSPADRR